MKPSYIAARILRSSRPIAKPSGARLFRANPVRHQSTSAQPTPTRRHWVTRDYFVGFLAVAGFTTSGFYFTHHSALAESPSSPSTSVKSQTKHIRLSEVKEHCDNHDRKWVIKGRRVYDITDWIPAHPGGEVILRAAGASLDPYWDIFSIHQSQDVLDILESYYIGDLDPQDLDANGKVPSTSIEDPFVNDPERDPRLIIRTAKPCNAESPEEALSTYITPCNLFYVRQHLWVPPIPRDPEKDHTLTIELPTGDEVTYSLSDLKRLFPPHTITATLQCSGNRRAHLSSNTKPASGLPWTTGAISNATWTGVRLRDVLAHAGFPVEDYDDPSSPHDADIKAARHVRFTGAEAYGSSIPLCTATDRHADVLLAWAMNGQPLLPDHGAPLRALVPGTVAARSVKWLTRVEVGEDESPSQWQRRDYKCFGPNVKSVPKGEEGMWDELPAIQECPVQSAITSIARKKPHGHDDAAARPGQAPTRAEGEAHQGCIEVSGYAFSGAGRRIVRVDVSADDGKTWCQAELLPPALDLPVDDAETRAAAEAGRYDKGNDHENAGGSGSRPDDWHRGSKEWAWTKWRWLYRPDDTNTTSSSSSSRSSSSSDNSGNNGGNGGGNITSKAGAAAGAAGAVFVVKAIDEGYNTQPETYEANWNFKGNLTNAWHRVKFGGDER